MFAVFHALRIERSANDVVAHAGKVFDASAAQHDDRVFLQVVSFAWDVSCHLVAVRQAHARDLAQCRVGFFRRRCVDARAYAALLRTAFQGGNFVARIFGATGFAHQLINCRHELRALVKGFGEVFGLRVLG